MALPVRTSTRIANLRRARGIRQDELAVSIGMSVATLRRLERGEMDNPPLRYLQNVAIVFGVRLEEVIEPRWRAWWPRPGSERPPARSASPHP